MSRKQVVMWMGMAILAASQAANATLIGADRLLGIIEPGTPADPANEMVMVNGLLEGWGSVLGYNDGAASGSVMGNNPSDPQSESYTLKYSGSTLIPIAPAPLASAVSYNLATGNAVIDLNATPFGSYDWVLAKWGRDAAAYWIGDITGGTIELTRDGTGWGAQAHGLSGYTLFNGRTSVPDGGVTALLMGIGMLGLGFLKSRLS